MKLFGICLAFAALATIAGAQVSLSSLKRGHPRIAFTEQDEQRVRNLMNSDPLLRRLVERNNQLADRGISQATAKRVLRGPRLLDQSRLAIERVLQEAMAYRLTGNRKYAERGIQEMVAVANFSDWNPSHFLDVGEMLAALGLGYDWLYDAMDSRERQIVRRAIVEKGLKVATQYQDRKAQMWMTGDNNWTSVVNGGLIVAALAVADEEPALAKTVIERGVRAIRQMDKVYRPDGATHEGPAYWHYGFTYHALANRALATALPGHTVFDDAVYAKTGNFPIYMQGTNGQFFNYADGKPEFYVSPAMFELSRTFNEPFYAWWTRSKLQTLLGPRFSIFNNEYRFFPLFIAWYDQRGSEAQGSLDRLFGGRSQVFSMRGSWTDPQASFVGAKGGDNSLSHAQQDVGSFVFDALGTRWAVDLGSDDYNLPGYWDDKEGGKRWTIFRNEAESHNTLTIGRRQQRISGLNQVSRTSFNVSDPFAIVDMTPAYKGAATTVKRGLRLIDRKDLLVQDEVTGATGEIRWIMMTAANISASGDRATLTQGGRTLTARILAPDDARFTVITADPGKSGENKNAGHRRLAVHVGGRKNATIVVQLSPGGSPRPSAVTPLANWR